MRCVRFVGVALLVAAAALGAAPAAEKKELGGAK